MKESPLVSILIPCYNHEVFLDDCIRSILAQDYDNIEVLICDDNSPDNSFEKIKTYEKALTDRFSNVVILRNEENCGVTKNINRMLKLAKGEYIKTIASDDAMVFDAISSMVNFLQENSDVDVVVSNGFKVPEKQHYPDFTDVSQIYQTAPDFSPEGFFQRVARCNEISAPAAMVRMTVYQKFGFYDENIKVEDFEFWLRILKEGNTRFGFLNKNLIYYRINANSMTSMTSNASLAKRRKLIHASEIETLNKYAAFFENDTFSDIILSRTLAERGFAIVNKLSDYEKKLNKEIKRFFSSNKLPFKIAVKYRFIYIKQTLRKYIKNS